MTHTHKHKHTHTHTHTHTHYTHTHTHNTKYTEVHTGQYSTVSGQKFGFDLVKIIKICQRTFSLACPRACAPSSPPPGPPPPPLFLSLLEVPPRLLSGRRLRSLRFEPPAIFICMVHTRAVCTCKYSCVCVCARVYMPTPACRCPSIHAYTTTSMHARMRACVHLHAYLTHSTIRDHIL